MTFYVDETAQQLWLYSKANSGSISKFVLAEDPFNDTAEIKPTSLVRMSMASALRLIRVFDEEQYVKLSIDRGQLLLDDAKAKAVVLLSSIGSDVG